jgi:hypothetical protein
VSEGVRGGRLVGFCVVSFLCLYGLGFFVCVNSYDTSSLLSMVICSRLHTQVFDSTSCVMPIR